ncbi:hypothetical protein LELG_05451 [Lodderomyces elongisporus NRRL YB-4239]|uniref:Uncharacterized protein n=1 Tax=Lodderomyces elongisporus (strain ATCC 11503 / CBS 2605 / JCM 1781 / NBRC 1676 / NRRL YB-4239) TaxID=379508 RepID=A5E762_LODEL|nr:hypothetical protein LELG_05451 [Lodderomyces elongisporus NRRL YB-4239]
MTSAGQAAAAALRLHSSPVQNNPNQFNRTAAQRQYGAVARSNSLSSSGRANSLRQYTYNPLASYNPVQSRVGVSRRSNSLTAASLQSRGSLTRSSQLSHNQLQQRHSNLYNSQQNQNQNQNQHQQHQHQQQQYGSYLPEETEDELYYDHNGEHISGQRRAAGAKQRAGSLGRRGNARYGDERLVGQGEEQGLEEEEQDNDEEEEEEEEFVVTTTTTKVVDAHGRVQSITTKTIKTFPDGSNIVETSTKNISRSNSRNNSLSSANYRNNSLTQIPISLSKIDEDLQNFDYDYQVDEPESRGNALKLNTDEEQRNGENWTGGASGINNGNGNGNLDSIQETTFDGDDDIDDTLNADQAAPHQALGEAFEPPKAFLPSQDRTSSLDSRGQPLRSILKTRVEDRPTEREVVPTSPSAKQNSAAAAASAASAAVHANSPSKQPQASASNHPYKNLADTTSQQQRYAPQPPPPQQQHYQQQHYQQQQQQQQQVRTLRSPRSPLTNPASAPSPKVGLAGRFTSPSQSRDRTSFGQSSGSSIKFDDHVETIPVPVNKTISTGNSTSSPHQHISNNKSKTSSGTRTSNTVSPDFYAAAMQAAYRNVYGDRDPGQVPPPPPSQTETQTQVQTQAQQQPQQQPPLPQSSSFNAGAPTPNMQPQQYEPQQEKKKFGFLSLSPRKQRAQSRDYSTEQQLQVVTGSLAAPQSAPATALSPVQNNNVAEEGQQNSQPEELQGVGGASGTSGAGQAVPANYEYSNHHEQFKMYSMRDAPAVSANRKERAKEEKRLVEEREKDKRNKVKEQLKAKENEQKRVVKEHEEEEKRLIKERAENEKRAEKEYAKAEKQAEKQAQKDAKDAKDAKKKDRKLFGGLFGKKRRQSQLETIASKEGANTKPSISEPVDFKHGAFASPVIASDVAGTGVNASAGTGTGMDTNGASKPVIANTTNSSVQPARTPPTQTVSKTQPVGAVYNTQPLERITTPQKQEVVKETNKSVASPGQKSLDPRLASPQPIVNDTTSVSGSKKQPTAVNETDATISTTGVSLSNDTQLSEPAYLSPAVPIVVNDEFRGSGLEESGDALDDEKFYKISVPRNYSHEGHHVEDGDKIEDNEKPALNESDLGSRTVPTPANANANANANATANAPASSSTGLASTTIQSASNTPLPDQYYPLPNLSSKPRNSVYDAAPVIAAAGIAGVEAGSKAEEGHFGATQNKNDDVSRVSVPQLNEINDDDDDDDKEEEEEEDHSTNEPSFKSYEHLSTATDLGEKNGDGNKEDLVAVIDEGLVLVEDDVPPRADVDEHGTPIISGSPISDQTLEGAGIVDAIIVEEPVVDGDVDDVPPRKDLPQDEVVVPPRKDLDDLQNQQQQQQQQQQQYQPKPNFQENQQQQQPQQYHHNEVKSLAFVKKNAPGVTAPKVNESVAGSQFIKRDAPNGKQINGNKQFNNLALSKEQQQQQQQQQQQVRSTQTPQQQDTFLTVDEAERSTDSVQASADTVPTTQSTHDAEAHQPVGAGTNIGGVSGSGAGIEGEDVVVVNDKTGKKEKGKTKEKKEKKPSKFKQKMMKYFVNSYEE